MSNIRNIDTLNNDLQNLENLYNNQNNINQNKSQQPNVRNFHKPGNNVHNPNYKNPYVQQIVGNQNNQNNNFQSQSQSQGNGDIINRHNNTSQQNQNIVNNQLNQHQQFNPKLFVQNEQYNNNSLVDQQIKFQNNQITNQQNLNPHYNNIQNQKFNANQQHYQGQQQFSQQTQFTRNPQQFSQQTQNQTNQNQTNQSSSDGYVDPRENMNDRMGMLRFDNVAHNRSNLVPVNMNHIYTGNLFSEGNPIPEDLKHLYHNENINSSNRILHQEKSKTMYKDDINQRMSNMTQMSNSRFGFVTDSQQQQINQQNSQIRPSAYNTNNPNQYQPNGLDMYYGAQSNPQTPQQIQQAQNIHKSLQPSASDMKLANRNAMNNRLNQFELMNNTKPMIQYPGQGVNPVNSFMPEMTK